MNHIIEFIASAKASGISAAHQPSLGSEAEDALALLHGILKLGIFDHDIF
jgi:hypothetical protein